MLGRVNARTERSQRAPAGSLRAYQIISFNNFHNSLFFVIVIPKNVRRSVCACKTSQQIPKTYPYFFGPENLLGSASISWAVQSEVGRGKLPGLPPPPVATPLSTGHPVRSTQIRGDFHVGKNEVGLQYLLPRFACTDATADVAHVATIELTDENSAIITRALVPRGFPSRII